jgi:GxxExxY protein
LRQFFNCCNLYRKISENEIASVVVDSAIKVHKDLGPGLLESSYQDCLLYELRSRGLFVEKEKAMPLIYKGVEINKAYRIDLFVENKFVVEVKSVDALSDVHISQVLTYLKLSESKLGLLINFNTNLLKNGIKRLINGHL